jgi:hypothetical protein
MRDDARRKQEMSERTQILSERTQLFEEFKAGLWTKDEYLSKVEELTYPKPPPAKRRREYSPDWNLERFDDDRGEQN